MTVTGQSEPEMRQGDPIGSRKRISPQVAAKAGTQRVMPRVRNWLPAYAGMGASALVFGP